MEIDTATSKPSLSSERKPFHLPLERCVLKEKHIRRFRKRFQFPERTIICLPCPNEKACAFAHNEMCFYEASFLCGLRFPIHPIIMELLSTCLNSTFFLWVCNWHFGMWDPSATVAKNHAQDWKMHCSRDPQTFFSKIFIKNGFLDTIYIFKNYFTTMFSVFSFH